MEHVKVSQRYLSAEQVVKLQLEYHASCSLPTTMSVKQPSTSPRRNASPSHDEDSISKLHVAIIAC